MHTKLDGSNTNQSQVIDIQVEKKQTWLPNAEYLDIH